MAKPSRSSSSRSTSKQSKQSGGTFLGIVLGLIVGLAIAVVVALYITRAPTPFVSKVAPPAASDTGAASGAQYDPNRALQGKTPGQPVPQAAQPAPPNTAPGQSNNQTQSSGMLEEPEIIQVPPANNGVAVGPQPSTGGSGATEQAKKPQSASAPVATARATPPGTATQGAGPAAPAAKPGSPTATANNEVNTGYFLQVGAYKTEADAEQQRARLAFQGFESKVSQRDAGGVTYFRVRIGPFSKFDDMNSARQRLSDAGVDTAVIRFTKQ
ncbi:SPOR domain-containing protein [Trinickia mobilis]|uniref:SPOR domain-containing protein n=1 Tax=Trinickia mobilis TaxID=2816356 RepID=UPI001A8FB42A|nr:SPOR domain-containing protein [Trinickia mobilis]